MRREVRCVALSLAVLLSAPGLLAASRPAKPEAAPAAAADPISAALCGHGKGHHTKLAKALDDLNPLDLPQIWQREEVETLQTWLKAPPICPEASELAADRYRSRRRVLDELGRQLARAKATDRIGTALAPFRGRSPSSEAWPSDLECDACAALRSAAARVADIASRWPAQKGATLGPLLKAATQREDLVAGLCAAQPSPNAQAEIERQFRYYSWTASAARLFEVAALFEKPEIVAECRGR
jgi:hypothetical protein